MAEREDVPQQSLNEDDQARQKDRLRRQATALRRSGPLTVLRPSVRYSALQRGLIITLIVFTLSGSLFLLLAGGQRRSMIAALSREWGRLYASDASKGIFKLPPPPPKSVEAKTVIQQPVMVFEPEPGPGPVYEVDPGSGEVEKKHIPPAKNADSEAAYRVLQAKSELVAKLVAGELPEFTFKEWNPLQAKPPVFLIQVVAVRGENEEVGLVWSVDIQSAEIQPLSQAARDLTRRQN